MSYKLNYSVFDGGLEDAQAQLSLYANGVIDTTTGSGTFSSSWIIPNNWQDRVAGGGFYFRVSNIGGTHPGQYGGFNVPSAGIWTAVGGQTWDLSGSVGLDYNFDVEFAYDSGGTQIVGTGNFSLEISVGL